MSDYTTLWGLGRPSEGRRSSDGWHVDIQYGYPIDAETFNYLVAAPERLKGYIPTSRNQQEYYRAYTPPKKVVSRASIIDITWIFLVQRSSDETGSKWLGETIDGVNRLIAIGEFRQLDQALEAVNVETASRQILLGLSRSTYPVRSKLSYWKTFLAKVHAAFIKRDLDADRLLRGLI